MGLLKENKILEWDEIKKVKADIKKSGIKQFIEIYHQNKNVKTETKALGEEIEFNLLKNVKGSYKLFCGGENIINNFKFCTVEYGRYMVEMVSVIPFEENTLVDIEKCILKRIKKVENELDEDEELLLMPCFPNFNFNNFFDSMPMKNEITLSENFPDNAISLHDRFNFLTKNIRSRRGRKIEGYVKTMVDDNTHIKVTDVYNLNNFSKENITQDNITGIQTETNSSALLDKFDADSYVLIDSMGQGMGCCGLQLTIQSRDIEKNRYIYDMLGILSPIFLRLSRGTPLAQGRLLSTETRWEIIEMAVDCRTDEERGQKQMVSGLDDFYPYSSKIPKSRFSSIDLFISNNIRNLDEYNNINVPIDTDSYFNLVNNGIDEKMAKHISSLFIRDPVISYANNETNKIDDFENIQTSNWRSVRFKIPTHMGDERFRGWKNEIRVMDVQATPFENTSLILFSYFLAHATSKYNLNLYIPLSYVDANFKRANKFIRSPSEYLNKLDEDIQKFYYRINIDDIGPPIITEGTLKEIILGTENYKGLMYFVEMIISDEFYHSKKHIMKYIEFVKDRLKNKYISLSDFIRKFVICHHEYKNDSVVSDSIIQDLITKLVEIRKKNDVSYLLNI